MGLISQNDGQSSLSIPACCAGIAFGSIVNLRKGNGIIHIRIIGRQLDLGHIVKEHSMGRLYHQGSTCNAAVILGGRIIRPGSGAVLVLPLADGNALHLGRQCGLCGPHKGRTGIILKDIGIRIYQAQLGVFCVADQSERDVRGNVDRIPRLRIVVADIAEISQHPGRGYRQVILADCQNTSCHTFSCR